MENNKCYHCKESCNEDQFCHGCKQYICEDCSKNYEMPWGGHDPDLHLEIPYEESYENEDED